MGTTATLAESQEERNRIDMLKKIKKARDLVFNNNTGSKRRSRRQAIASQDTTREQQERIQKNLYNQQKLANPNTLPGGEDCPAMAEPGTSMDVFDYGDSSGR